MTMPTLLLVSLNFPPSQIASVHRARHLAKHLPDFGWRPVVIAVDERFHKESIDPALGSLVPPSIEIHRSGAWPLALTRHLGLGDLALRSMHQVWCMMRKLTISEKPNLVFITGWPFYQMLLSKRIKKQFGLPVVLDFQDPWVSYYGGSCPIWSKQGLSHRLAAALEPRAVRWADFITSVSETQNKQMAARYPWLDSSRLAAIPIGGDPDDFEQLRFADVILPDSVLDPARVNLSFVGTFMPRSGPLVRLVLQAFDRLRREQPELANRIRFNFVGTSNQPNDCRTLQVMPIAQEMGVADAVHETPQRLPYLQALAVLARSDGLLLIGSDEPHYTASKIYPALMSGRPYLSLFHRASSSHAILSSAGGGFAHAFCEDNDAVGLVAELAMSLRKLVLEPDQLGRVDRAAYASIEACAIAARFAAIFDEVSRNCCIRGVPES